jgi:2'-5' RNA ligase
MVTIKRAMSFDPLGAHRDVPLEERLNLFALVIYVPDPLGQFLDGLRRELVPHDNPHAHVSVLPPRPLRVDWPLASAQVRTLTEAWNPFDIELTHIGVFPVTDVVYIELGAGAAELRRMHAAMNRSALDFVEPYSYHPHLTLAQEIVHRDVAAVRDTAVERWRRYQGPRRFRAERAVLVQNTLNNRWIDLAEFSLGAVAVR